MMRPSVIVWENGFCSQMCLPFASAAQATSVCQWSGRQISTASMDGSSMMSW